MSNKIKVALVFLFIGIFNTQLSSVICWRWLDDLNCYSMLQWLCNAWDSAEFYIAHKAFSLLFYKIGSWGFVGSVLWHLESKYLSGFIGKVINVSNSIFGPILAAIVSFLIMETLGNLLGLNQLFELLYSLIH